MALLNYLASLIPVSEYLREALNEVIISTGIKKGEMLIRRGERCSDIYFIERGLLRGFYPTEEKEITNWLAREGEFATSFYPFITQSASFETIEALEDCELSKLSHSVLQQLYTGFPETERLGRILTENYYVKLEGRLLGLQFTTAKERYDNLVKNNPQLVQRVPLGYIASYLGITQETLSRIRAKY